MIWSPLKILREGLLCGLLIALIALALQAGFLLNRAEQALSFMEGQVYYQNLALIRSEAAAASALVNAAHELKLAREDLAQRSGEALLELHGHLEEVNVTLNRTGAYFARAADSIALDVENVAGKTAQIESQVSDALNQVFDCMKKDAQSGQDYADPDCFQARYVETSRAIERAAEAWGNAAPRQAQAGTELLEHGARAAEHTEQITGELAKRPPLWLRVLKWARWLRPW